MKQNMGNLDRFLRILFAILIGALYLGDAFSGATAVILGIFAVTFIVTGLAGFCPLYVPLKVITRKRAGRQS